jgi:choline dehydrogenase-like flavoprotein
MARVAAPIAGVNAVSTRQRRALDAICDTFHPGTAELGAADAFLELFGSELRPAELRRLLWLLSFFGVRRFGRHSQERRERILLAWCNSRSLTRRAAFHGLRKAALALAYGLPGERGTPNPTWERIGYPGPIGPIPEPPPKAIEPLPVTRDLELDCDVCVVGSGAGGGTAAARLAAAGLDVVVLEAGGYYDDLDFDGAELRGYERYLGNASSATLDQSVGILAGACLGGGTVVNYTTSFRTPEEVREEWAGHGVPAFTSRTFTKSLNLVCERLGVNLDHNRRSRREELVHRGLARLGWHEDSMPRNVLGCDQGVSCGYCPYGCRLGAKQSTVKTWLADAYAAGARILVGTRAERVLVERGATRGVLARTGAGHVVNVRSRAVVVACGSIMTPALLRASGLGNRVVGRHLRLHPVAATLGIFEEEVRPWEGTMQAIYSDEHRHLDGAYGLKYETTAAHPTFIATFTPWPGAAGHAELMDQARNAVGIGALLRDRGEGGVDVDRGGRPIVHYHLSSYDARHLRTGVEGMARILDAAGARRVVLGHAQLVDYEPGTRGTLEDYMRAADAAGYGPARLSLFSFHQMGTARMGGSASDSACDPEGQVWGVRNAVVCDASTFPTASGVNPMVTIEAIAHMNASALAERLS